MSNDTTRLSGYPKFSISVVTKAPPTAAPIEDNSIPLEGELGPRKLTLHKSEDHVTALSMQNNHRETGNLEFPRQGYNIGKQTYIDQSWVPELLRKRLPTSRTTIVVSKV
ncbi:uncharacterized protein LOC143255957 [Tachypleus tridentatus]|uniref:uncharacterized protein LOC143255957 n=1 Tax=Tachypleus tridentatus TaxID=6853 RepID=UPI003FD286B0